MRQSKVVQEKETEIILSQEQDTSDSGYKLMDFVEAEAELQELKERYHIQEEEKQPLWKRLGDRYVDSKDKKKPVQVEKKKYCLTALFLGWLGVHQFMIGRKKAGVLYLLTSWMGISFALSVLDIFQAAFLKVDENNLITLP